MSREPTDLSDPRQPDGVSNDDLLRFVDGALDDEGRVRVLTHLATRPDAVARVEAYLHQNARLRTLREHLPMAGSAAFASPLQKALVARLSRQRTRHGWRGRVAAAACTLVLAAGAVGLAVESWHSQAPAPGRPAEASALAQAFFLYDKSEIGAALAGEGMLVEFASAVDSTTPPPRIDSAAFAWLAGQLSDVSIAAPDFDRIGLELVGGETLERQGTPAIRLVYRDAAENPVLLYVGIGKPDAEHAFWLVREGYVSLQWRRGPIVFAIVAPTDMPQLSNVVDLVGAAIARLPAPERNDAAEPAAQTDAAAGDGGPLQAIAVPAIPAAPAAGQAAEPGNLSPADALPELVDENEPEAL